MGGLTKREKIFKTLEGKKTGYIPVILSSTGFALERSVYPAAECRKDPIKFADAMVSSRQYFGYDGLWSGLFQGVTSYMGGGLIDKFGRESLTGEATVMVPEDMKKLRPFALDQCEPLSFIKETIAELKKREPDEPIISIMDNPSMVAAALMDGGNYYYNIVKNPQFVHEMTELVFDSLVLCAEEFIKAGADIIWLPMPTIGGTCISRKHYEQFCTPYNKKFNRILKDKGAHIIVHTCGNWNDRFDVVTQENAHCMHVSLADLSSLKENFGDSISLMGQLPSVFTMMMGSPEQVKKEGIDACLSSAVDGGFILSSDCGLPAKTPEENVFAIIAAAREAEQLLGDKC